MKLHKVNRYKKKRKYWLGKGRKMKRRGMKKEQKKDKFYNGNIKRNME